LLPHKAVDCCRCPGTDHHASPDFQRLIDIGGKLEVDLPPASRNVEIKPYAISRLTTDRLSTPRLDNHPDGDLGVDAKYGVTANLTADVTLNTDFAQVEVDEQQVNLTRFNLVFPEKREFFLENRGVFTFAPIPSTGANMGNSTTDTPALFYSRRIGLNAGRVIPIDVGTRLSGKAGGFGIGLMNIETGDDQVSNTPATNFTVLRVKRDVFRRSSIGAMFTNRSASAPIRRCRHPRASCCRRCRSPPPRAGRPAASRPPHPA